MSENYFEDLYSLDVRDKTVQKNGLNYLKWAVAHAEAKKYDPETTYEIKREVLTYAPDGTTPQKTRPWFDDGKTGWVEVTVTMRGISHTEILPVLDFKNKPIPAENITSYEANKSIQRAITKAYARHGIGLYLYEGEDMPEEVKVGNKLQTECMELIKKKCALSEATKVKVGNICKELLPDEEGNPALCDDNDKLKELKKKLMAVRKVIE